MTDWLIDKSTLWTLAQSPDYEVWLDRINRGKVWAGLPTKLEVAVSARNPQHWPTLRQHLLEPLLDAAATPRSEAVAVEIMEAPLGVGLQRCIPLPDVMIASLAVVGRLTVLHHDRDFDRINKVYGDPAIEWPAL
ncbi:MAG: PIN domain-containing protein [Pseudonocardiaceae bacterium]